MSVFGVKKLRVFCVYYTNVHIMIILCNCSFFFCI